MKLKYKMYLVKREVMARNIKHAMSVKGTIYSLELVDEEHQPEYKKKIGFKIKK